MRCTFLCVGLQNILPNILGVIKLYLSWKMLQNFEFFMAQSGFTSELSLLKLNQKI